MAKPGKQSSRMRDFMQVHKRTAAVSTTKEATADLTASIVDLPAAVERLLPARQLGGITEVLGKFERAILVILETTRTLAAGVAKADRATVGCVQL